VDEGRKRVLLIAASILAARKLAQYDGGKRVPATISAIDDAIRWAEQLMAEIDRRPDEASAAADALIGGVYLSNGSMSTAARLRMSIAPPIPHTACRAVASLAEPTLMDTKTYGSPFVRL
jgi:hypothetical protein